MANFITVKDGTQIFFKDWGKGKPVVFSHGWPVTADCWNPQMLFLRQRGYRVIAHDRRGHGRSSQPDEGHNMDVYADDLAILLDKLDVMDATLIGHSTGGGEVTRYIGKHGTHRVSKVILIGPVVPLIVQTADNPDGVPIAVFDGIRRGTALDRSEFLKQIAVAVYGFNRPGAKVSQGLIDSLWSAGMMGAINAEYDCIKALSETDFTEDLKKFDVPTLFLHGDDDQIVPLELSSKRASKLVPNASLKIYPGAPHGLPETMVDEVNADILAFIEG
jgi:non-heme chloroperoxidase